MRSSPGPTPLAASASAELARLEAQLGQAADPWARGQLAELGDALASRVLRKVAEAGARVRNLSAFIKWLAKQEAMQRNAEGIPTAESAACCSGPFRASPQEDSISGPFYEDDVQMEVQSPYGGMSFGLSNQARIEPVSPVRQMPCRLQYHESPVRTNACIVPDLVEMEVESPPGWNSPGMQNQSPFSAVASPVANPGGMGVGCLEYQMPYSPARVSTPSPVRDITMRIQQMDGPSRRVGVMTAPSVAAWNALRATASPQMLALGELEFDRFFLIRVYLADKKIEEVLEDVNYIRYLNSLPMDCFESEIWNKFGKNFVPASDRRKNLDWDPNKTRLYHCIVEKRDDSISTIFKGPYVENTRTHLQKIVGDDNVLIVKFADIPGLVHNTDKLGIYGTFYSHVADDGILLGLRRYRFFIHKDGGKEEKLKEEKKIEKNKKCSPSVRCYFVRMESGWERDHPYDLSGHTIDQARRLFMHIHNAPTVAKYLSRFALILSKTIKLDVDLSKVHVEIIDDEPCRYDSGQIAVQDGERLIHTDGTGLISADLARKCPTSVFKGNFLKDAVDSKGHRYLTTEHPLLMQFRMFHNGYAVKGTLLVDKRLPSETIRIRPSMIKIYGDKNQFGEKSFDSLEIITTSNRPKRALTSRFLISLLHYGRVPAEYFVELLRKALEDVNKVRRKPRDSLEVAFNHADLDDSMSARMILSGIQPEDETYLQFQLALMTKEERKGLKQGRIPIDECYYLMGTTDPTGTLKRDQVCVILDNGQLSGKVLVYKHPGLHFGDIHKLTATYIDGLEDIVGNSKYAIFFPTCGPRSLADEMANSDYDGDMYWVSRNPLLLERFKPRKPWVRRISPRKTEQKKPQDYPGSKLECLLFREYLKARFAPSYVLGAAADSWLAFMDRLLIGDIPKSERKVIKRKMLDLVDIYYLALDAPKSGNKITVPEELMVKQYPHFMERGRHLPYHSASVLGKIYDEVTSQESEAGPSFKIVPLPCFTEVAVSEDYKRRWTALYQEYLRESSKLCKLENKAEKNIKFRELYQEYKWDLYRAEEFEYSPRERFDLFNEACAVYQVVYEHAMPTNEVSKCGFAWKVAGRALCQLYTLKHAGDTVLCSFSVLEGALKKNRT
ncbi:unnamed protein product [Urochloa decumbens]|uniref:RNA-dependent RNA polymerase n=1 Tax=Urochloa decumbens TaxID=240449 RepID=A0ABC9AJS3_9POAL